MCLSKSTTKSTANYSDSDIQRLSGEIKTADGEEPESCLCMYQQRRSLLSAGDKSASHLYHTFTMKK